LVPRGGAAPEGLTLEQALAEAESRSPAVTAAQASVDAAQGRLRQAGVRSNPELSVEVENFAGSGPYSGFEGTETTVAINQRLDLGGRRSARVAQGRAELTTAQLQLSLARADLALAVREQFATAVAAREQLRLASDNLDRARELARIAGVLVEAGREPPLRALRARAAAAQADASLRGAQAAEEASRRTLASLFGTDTLPAAVSGSINLPPPTNIDPTQTLDVRLAEAERLTAEARLGGELASRRLDPAVGVGVRQIEETGDRAFVAGLSVPLPLFDQNRGNIAAARAEVRAAEARRAGALANAVARVRNASAGLTAADARVAALEAAAIPEAREALRLAQISYQAGRLSLLELLDAQETFATVQSDLIEARQARAQAAAALDRAAAR
jgi:cobalt-zinc-cadmium efflux system outer membrane protein